MKYYGFLLETNEEQIKAASKVRYSEFCCDNGISTVNAFVQRNTPSSLSFFMRATLPKQFSLLTSRSSAWSLRTPRSAL